MSTKVYCYVHINGNKEGDKLPLPETGGTVENILKACESLGSGTVTRRDPENPTGPKILMTSIKQELTHNDHYYFTSSKFQKIFFILKLNLFFLYVGDSLAGTKHGRSDSDDTHSISKHLKGSVLKYNLFYFDIAQVVLGQGTKTR